MLFKTIALTLVVAALAAAPAAAMSSKRSRDSGPVSSGRVSSTSFDGVIGADGSRPVVSTSEPLAMLAVGLGLLAARLIRRRG